MPQKRLILLALAAPLLGGACSNSGGTPNTGPEAGLATDASLDSGQDAATEAATDASADAGQDVAAEVSVGVDAGGAPDASTDAEGISDASPETEAEAGTPVPFSVVADAQGAEALVTDGVNLYWIDSIPSDSGSLGRVMKVSVTGGTEVTLATTPGTATQDIAIDATNVYFTTASNDVWLVPKGGGSSPTHIASSNQSAPLTAANGFVYYADANGIANVGTNVDAGVPTTLATSGSPVDLVVVAGEVFWANASAGTLEYVSATSGGSPKTLLSPDPDAGTAEFVSGTAAQNLVTDGTSLYWNRVPGGSVPGAIMSIAAGGGSPAVVFNTGTDIPFSLVTDGTSAYYLSLGSVNSLVKVDLGTGGAVTLTTSDLAAANLTGTLGSTTAVDSTRVYWLDPPRILSLPK